MSEVLEAPAETAFPVGIGRFQIIEQLGSGLQGTVYKGYDPHLDRLVAIKLLNGSPMPGPADGRVSEGRASRHALEEGRNLGRLKHTNVIPVYEAGLHQGCPFLVFEYVEGTTLQNYLRQHGRLSVGTATVLMSQLVSGLAHAHQQEVLHLDLSPGNIQIDIDGVPRIMDFGLSRVKSQQHESGDALVGTPRYMTPEHFATGRLGAATDVFALALIWYEALAGQPAIQGSSTAEIEAAILGIAIEPPALEALGVDQWLATIVCKALHRDPTKRIQDACAFKDLLDRHVAARRSAPPAATAQAANHSTVEFLLRRMARKQDFPALSNNLVIINRLTADDSTAAGDELAKVVLRDYAVSNKLLKLANSAYFGSNGGSITKVSDAISRLGFDRVRMACTSLMYFSHTQGGEGTAELQELQISAFMSGLIARHLAFAAHVGDPEEAFICGMFRNLGRTLARYYFPEDCRAICELVEANGFTEARAFRETLGVGADELGMAVARTWKFPDLFVHCMGAAGEAPLAKPENLSDRMRMMAIFANELCELAVMPPTGNRRDAMMAFEVRYAACLTITDKGLCKLLGAALDKFRLFAPVLGVDPARSKFVKAMSAWLADEPAHKHGKPDAAPDDDEVAETTAPRAAAPVALDEGSMVSAPEAPSAPEEAKPVASGLSRIFSAFRRG